MKYANIIHFRVFCEPTENYEQVKKGLLELVGFSESELKEEKIVLKETKAKGFEDKIIRIIELDLKKDKHCNKFLKRLSEKISKEDRQQLIDQKNRLDDNLNFFIRFDKQKLLEYKYDLTESGNCYHTTINVSAFPKKKENAYKIIEELFKTQ
ncbi:hypothetical protein COV13_02700 [Candidatus Woesearchaeota archaeon CG10_big_fil_rev_8_21_14_0_10_32_9]|nr:MAG: hypothetical protein COV13_02700 [Candidatus Woesearchaeota archaeon CG10_big_fil_rev_8_21_14_0_10_32_9]